MLELNLTAADLKNGASKSYTGTAATFLAPGWYKLAVKDVSPVQQDGSVYKNIITIADVDSGLSFRFYGVYACEDNDYKNKKGYERTKQFLAQLASVTGVAAAPGVVDASGRVNTGQLLMAIVGRQFWGSVDVYDTNKTYTDPETMQNSVRVYHNNALGTEYSKTVRPISEATQDQEQQPTAAAQPSDGNTFSFSFNG